MVIHMTPKKIKEMCGTISSKKGEAFFRGNKVTIKNSSHASCEAIVSGTEDFHVSITNDPLVATCSCPKLASFQKGCQHIAAVLWAIYEEQSRLTDEVLSLFQENVIPPSRAQRHFEKRQLVDVRFSLHPFQIKNGELMLELKIKLDGTEESVFKLLNDLKQNKFDLHQYCFSEQTDDIIQLLYNEEQGDPSQFFISPLLWGRLHPLLIISREPLSLQFQLEEGKNKHYELKIDGINDVLVLPAYHAVFSKGTVTLLEKDDCDRLYKLKQMIEKSGTTSLPIVENQLHFFLENVVPGLKRLGDVHICVNIAEKTPAPPLVAKLFLDRAGNKLLAGLEFHYDHLVIHPLDEQELTNLLIRDDHQEKQILEMITESGFATTDGGFFLHNEELEYEFLHYVMPKLQKHAQVYATTAVKLRIFKGNTFPKIRIKVKKERTNWLEFKFEMKGFPENEIREVLAALEEKRKYYRLQNGALLSLESNEFQDIQQLLNSVSKEDLEKGLNVPITRGLRLIETVEGTKAFTFDESFQQFLDSLRHPAKYDVPQALNNVLRDYQKQGYQWFRTLASFGFGGILADDMGLGKTLQSITFIMSEITTIQQRQTPVLVVCPTSLTYNWLGELGRFAPEVKAVIIDGTKKERKALVEKAKSYDVVITSYPLLRLDIAMYENILFHTIFFDEAQAFKNPITQTARAVKKLNAQHRFALTGTPIENSLVELWSIYHVVFPELFLSLKEFSFLTNEAIARRTQLFLLRRMKEDVLEELPKKIEMVERSELLPEQKTLYAAYLAKLKHDMLKHLDKDTLRKNRIKILAGLTRLRQICCHPSLFVEGYNGSSAKFEQLLEILREAKLAGRRVLIFSQFTKMLELIGKQLSRQGRSFFYLDGQTPPEDRVEICHRFNNGDRDLFLISLRAGGTGLNLTGADTVILYDIWWNPAVEEQAADRAHRIGQKNVVQVIKLVAQGTIEEKMNELQEKKRDLIEAIIDQEQKQGSGLTEEDIREILMIDERL